MSGFDSENPQNISQLIEELQSEDQKKQLEAVQLAGKHRVNLAVPVIIELLNSLIDPYHSTQRQLIQTCLWALGEIGDPRAIPTLIDSLDNVFYKIQFAALVALGKLRAQSAVEPVWKLLSKQDEYPVFVQLTAIETLGKIANDSARKRLAELLSNPEWDNMQIKNKVAEMLNYAENLW